MERIVDICSMVKVWSNPKCSKPAGILHHGQERAGKELPYSGISPDFGVRDGGRLFSWRPGKMVPFADGMRVGVFIHGAGG